MEAITREISKIMRQKAREDYTTPTVIIMTDNGRTIKLMAMASTSQSVVAVMKATGRAIKDMDTENRIGQTVPSSRATMNLMKKMEMAVFIMPTGIFTKESSKIAKDKAKAS